MGPLICRFRYFWCLSGHCSRMRTVFGIFFDLHFLDKNETDAPATILRFCLETRKKFLRIVCSSWSFLDMFEKKSFLNSTYNGTKNNFETKNSGFKKGTMDSICIKLLIFRRIQSYYPGVLQQAR